MKFAFHKGSLSETDFLFFLLLLITIFTCLFFVNGIFSPRKYVIFSNLFNREWILIGLKMTVLRSAKTFRGIKNSSNKSNLNRGCFILDAWRGKKVFFLWSFLYFKNEFKPWLKSEYLPTSVGRDESNKTFFSTAAHTFHIWAPDNDGAVVIKN